jgi:hypothetical protein
VETSISPDIQIAADVIHVAVGVDDVFNLHSVFLCGRDDPVRIRRRIDDERLAAHLITHQVGENRHRADLPLLDEHIPSRFQGA